MAIDIMEEALFEKARIAFGTTSGMHSPKQIWLCDFLILSWEKSFKETKLRA